MTSNHIANYFIVVSGLMVAFLSVHFFMADDFNFSLATLLATALLGGISAGAALFKSGREKVGSTMLMGSVVGFCLWQISTGSSLVWTIAGQLFAIFGAYVLLSRAFSAPNKTLQSKL